MDDAISHLLRKYHETGDIAAAEEIIQKIAPDLGRFLQSRISKRSARSDAWEDALQETVVGVAEMLAAFDGSDPEKFRSWCFAVARNKLANQFRGTKTELNTIVDPDLLREALSDLSSKELSPEGRADLNRAISLIRASDPPCVGYLWDRYVVGLSFRILGETYGISEEAATKRVQRCLALAQKLIRDKETPQNA